MTKSVFQVGTLVLICTAAVFSCDYGFDESRYLEEGVDTTQTDDSLSRLSSLTLQKEDGSAIPTNPSFTTGVYSYTVLIPRTVATLSFTWIPASPDAKVQWTAEGATLNDGVLSWPLNSETQTLEIEVRGINLTKATYRITVSKERALSTVNTLASLSVGAWPLNPPFSPEVMNYTVSLPPGTSLTTVKGLVKYTKGAPEQKITEQGWSQTTTLPFWTTIKVVAEDLTTRTYRVDFLPDS